MKTNIKYSRKNHLSDDEFDSNKIKIRVTTFIDLDIIEKLKQEAKSTGKKYQTLLNEKLRQYVLEDETIQTTLTNLDKRLSLVEKKIIGG
jgi:uncharacterized protein (DUF4415 family)